MDKIHISIIAALGRDRGIGYQNKLLWRIPQDLANFKKLTMGKPVIMGRKTFESIGRPLPGRQNIVLTRGFTFRQPGVLVSGSLEEAIGWAEGIATSTGENEIFVIGGSEIYQEALPLAGRLYLTLIDELKPADAFFPAYEESFSKQDDELWQKWNDLKYRFVVFDRKK